MKIKRAVKITAISFLCFISVLLIAALTVMVVKFVQYKSIRETGLPKMYISTDNAEKILSKEKYVKCSVSIAEAESEYCIENINAGVRGRGNNSWVSYPKKPYRLKFDKKISLFGESENKSWVLLAMYSDFSYMKDRLAFTLADAIGTDAFVPSYNYVELYINGKYNGLYLLTDQVDENDGRAGVKEDFDSSVANVPFLVELDAYAPDEGVEGIDWFKVSGRPYNIKYPASDERYTDAQFDYIKSYVETVDALCRKPNVTMKELSEYIDMKSFMDYYIVSEVLGQFEINWKSVYMSKSSEGKLVMGPLWDFDFSVTGSHAYYKERDLYKDNCKGLRSSDNWFASLLKGSSEFRAALFERWSEVKPKILETLDRTGNEWSSILPAAKKDFLKWHWFRFYKGPEACADEVIEWCKNRVLWLDTVFK